MGLEMHTLSLCLYWCSLEKCASLRLWKESGWSAGRSSVDWCRYTHVVQQILNDDLVSGGGSFHQGSETRARLPVGQIKSNILKNDSSVTLLLRSIKTLTWRWHLRGYPAGTWPSAGGPCPCSETGPSSLCRPSAPTQRLASGGKENRIGNQAAEPFLKDCKTESGAVPEAGSTQCSHCHSWRPASRRSTLWLWPRWRSHQPPAGGLQCCRGRCTRRTSAGSNRRCSCRPDSPHAWDRTQVDTRRSEGSLSLHLCKVRYTSKREEEETPTFWCTRPPHRTGRWSRRCAGPAGRPAPRAAPGSRRATRTGWHTAAPTHWLRRSARTFPHSSQTRCKCDVAVEWTLRPVDLSVVHAQGQKDKLCRLTWVRAPDLAFQASGTLANRKKESRT